MTFEKKLSANNRLSKTISPSFFLVALTVLAILYLDLTAPPIILIFVAVLFLVLILLVVKGYTTYDIYYDSNNMYLKNHKGVTTVPFSKVIKIKRTMSGVKADTARFRQYKVEYLDSADELHEIEFWPSLTGRDMDDFKASAKQVNANFDVEHWT